MQFSALPTAQGLYDPRHETDSCGVACLADLRGRPSHSLIGAALTALHNMDHRGAAGAEPSSGDGAGITVAVPDAFLRAVAGFELAPAAGSYATGIAFLPTDQAARDRVKAVVAETAAAEGLRVLGWRPVPIAPDGVGPSALAVMPAFEQLFVESTYRRQPAWSWTGWPTGCARSPSAGWPRPATSCTSPRCRHAP